MNNRFYQLYLDLFKTFGNPSGYWPQWCSRKKTPAEREMIALGAILTQRTSWRNVDISINNLYKNGYLSLEKIASLQDLTDFTNLIRPSGFFTTKPKRIFDFCKFVVKNYRDVSKMMNDSLPVLRDKLLALPGIGPETADTILLYALDKPTFIVDEYLRRFVKLHDLAEDTGYYVLKKLFENHLPTNPVIYQNYHALIIISQKGVEKSVMKKLNYNNINFKF